MTYLEALLLKVISESHVEELKSSWPTSLRINQGHTDAQTLEIVHKWVSEGLLSAEEKYDSTLFTITKEGKLRLEQHFPSFLLKESQKRTQG